MEMPEGFSCRQHSLHTIGKQNQYETSGPRK